MKITLRKFVKWKIFFDRSRIWVSYVQFLGMAYIVLKLLHNSPFRTWVFNHWYLSFPLIFIVFLVGCMVLGYIESLLKIREYEQENYSRANPEWEKLMKEIATLKQMLKKDEE